jgi:hypothetical protein
MNIIAPHFVHQNYLQQTIVEKEKLMTRLSSFVDGVTIHQLWVTRIGAYRHMCHLAKKLMKIKLTHGTFPHSVKSFQEFASK